jgi:hypothetical protein
MVCFQKFDSCGEVWVRENKEVWELHVWFGAVEGRAVLLVERGHLLGLSMALLSFNSGPNIPC